MQTLCQSPRVVFGVGAEAHAAELLVSLGAQRVLLVAQDRHADGAKRLADALAERCVGTFTTSEPQVPVAVADAAVALATATKADWVVAHGGGTPIGVAKAVALQLDVRVGAIPTTYAGSERTDIWGLSDGGRKTTGRDARVRPQLVVYDPALSLALPAALAIDSLFNALAHSLEALYAPDLTEPARASALASLPLLVAGIRGISADPGAIDAREASLLGAAYASEALGAVSMGLHHKLAHVLGGSFGAPHARTHATLISYVLGFNAEAIPAVLRACKLAWNTDDPPAFLYDLQRALGLTTSLRGLGLGEDDLPAVVQEVLARAYSNPRALGADALHELLCDMLHDRRPSLSGARVAMPSEATGPHAALRVSVVGAPLDRARAVILAIHGRGASADRFAGDLLRRLGPRGDVTVVAPQARDNVWYPAGFLAPLDDNQPKLGSALSVIDALYAWLRARFPAVNIVVAGFSQGGCLSLTWLSRTAHRPAQVLSFTGAPTPLPDADYAATSGVLVHCGSSAGDPYISREVWEAGVDRLRAAGAVVSASLNPGNEHTIHPGDDVALRAAVARAAAGDLLDYQAGYGAALRSEALPNALPGTQNSPRNVPYGLLAEQLNGTGFTVRRAENRRTWMYRLRTAVSAEPFVALPERRFTGDFSAGVSSPELLRFRPLPLPSAPTTFLDGLVTYAGAGDATMMRGAAVHLYAANQDMAQEAFCNIDGDLCVVPQHGALLVRTELGRLRVRPGEILVIPRGLRFAVTLPDGPARGFVAEVFDGSFSLPERGVVGANGLADERHFLAPVAAFDDDVSPHRIVVRHGGRLFATTLPHTPFDVVAWHGTCAPFKYDLAHFNSLGSVSFDHPDPSILTVLTTPMDARGRNAIDVAVFRSRWEVAEHTFRPPYAHRNSAVEFNAVIQSPSSSRFEPGSFLWTPTLTPHTIGAKGYEANVLRDEEAANAPEKVPHDSLWVQFESAYLMKVMPWWFDHPARDQEHLASLVGLQPGARLP